MEDEKNLFDIKHKLLKKYTNVEGTSEQRKLDTNKVNVDNLKHGVGKLSIEDRTNTIVKNKFEAVKSKISDVDFMLFQDATDKINELIFESKDKDWSRFITLLYSYVDWLYAHSINTAILAYIVG